MVSLAVFFFFFFFFLRRRGGGAVEVEGGSVYCFAVKASMVTTYIKIPTPTCEMAVHMAATDDVLMVTNFILSFPTGCLGWDL